jgi:YbbR domain-containing protein
MIDFLRTLLLQDFWLKLFSLVLAILIWLTVSFAIHKEVSPTTALTSANSEERTYYNIPVYLMSTAADVRDFKVSPSVVAVKVRGETRRLKDLQAREIRALIDLTGIESAPRGLTKRIEVTTPAGITFVHVIPVEVEVIVPPKR